MTRPYIQSLPVLLALVATTGCAIDLVGGTITVTKAFNAKVTAKDPAELLVDVPIGTVIIKPGDAGSADVSVTGTLGGADQATLDAVVVSVTQDADGKTSVIAKGPNVKSWKADLTITTPAKTSLNLKSGVGTVTLSGLEGKTEAKVGVGDLNVDKLALTGDSSFESGTGNVTLGITAWPKERALKAESGVGNVTVRLPANTGMNVDAATGVGKLGTKGLTLQGVAKSKTVGADVKSAHGD